MELIKFHIFYIHSYNLYQASVYSLVDRLSECETKMEYFGLKLFLVLFKVRVSWCFTCLLYVPEVLSKWVLSIYCNIFRLSDTLFCVIIRVYCWYISSFIYVIEYFCQLINFIGNFEVFPSFIRDVWSFFFKKICYVISLSVHFVVDNTSTVIV